MRNFLKENKHTIEELLAQYIEDNCDEVDMYELYDDMINETTDTSSLPGGCQIEPAKHMKENNPVIYRFGFAGYTGYVRDQYTEINGAYYDNDDIESAKDHFKDELYQDIETLIDEFELRRR